MKDGQVIDFLQYVSFFNASMTRVGAVWHQMITFRSMKRCILCRTKLVSSSTTRENPQSMVYSSNQSTLHDIHTRSSLPRILVNPWPEMEDRIMCKVQKISWWVWLSVWAKSLNWTAAIYPLIAYTLHFPSSCGYTNWKLDAKPQRHTKWNQRYKFERNIIYWNILAR